MDSIADVVNMVSNVVIAIVAVATYRHMKNNDKH